MANPNESEKPSGKLIFLVRGQPKLLGAIYVGYDTDEALLPQIADTADAVNDPTKPLRFTVIKPNTLFALGFVLCFVICLTDSKCDVVLAVGVCSYVFVGLVCFCVFLGGRPACMFAGWHACLGMPVSLHLVGHGFCMRMILSRKARVSQTQYVIQKHTLLGVRLRHTISITEARGLCPTFIDPGSSDPEALLSRDRSLILSQSPPS